MSYENPPLEDKFDAIQEAISWAARDSATVWALQDTERVREANTNWVELHVLRLAGVGHDEQRHEDVGGDYPMQTTMVGQRELRIQADFKSRDNRHVFAGYSLAESARTRLGSPFAGDTFFTPKCISLADSMDVINTPEGVVNDNRVESKAVLELLFLTVVTETDLAFLGSFIESIEVTSNLKVAGEESLDSSLQLDKEVMP